jgi:hypothetical protein
MRYSGPLHSEKSEVQRIEKHAIRKVFHSQLRQLWSIHPNLREWAEGVGTGSEIVPGVPNIKPLHPDEAFQKGVELMGSNWKRNDFSFLPLVTESLCLRCSLDILFLRAEERNYVLQGGDIDRRLIVLFDALRMVRQASEIPVGEKPAADENPMFVLLENDDLISELRVNTDRLLKLPEARSINRHDVYLQITVRLNTTRMVAHSWAFN